MRQPVCMHVCVSVFMCHVPSHPQRRTKFVRCCRACGYVFDLLQTCVDQCRRSVSTPKFESSKIYSNTKLNTPDTS